VVWRYESEAFGTGKPDKDPDGDAVNWQVRLRFPGQYADGETGLYYNWNRYYDPRIGRYVTSDPIGLKGGLNTYSYVKNSPFRYIDSRGLAPEDLFPTLSAAQQDAETYINDLVPNPVERFLYGVPIVPIFVQTDGGCWTYELHEVAVGMVPGPRGFRRKPGSLGKPKGADALRRENATVKQTGKDAGLSKDQLRELHKEAQRESQHVGRPLSYNEIRQLIRGLFGK
jgi:RHS repeat-associated protein